MAHIYVCPEYALASSILLRVSFVNLQKLTLCACEDWASMRMFAPAQKTWGLAERSTTAATSGCSKRKR